MAEILNAFDCLVILEILLALYTYVTDVGLNAIFSFPSETARDGFQVDFKTLSSSYVK
jgi:hypothetical protein